VDDEGGTGRLDGSDEALVAIVGSLHRRTA
jgi:hypothetical protein